jgi:3-oxoacyl-[acyl-carrier-protein] synthase II
VISESGTATAVVTATAVTLPGLADPAGVLGPTRVADEIVRPTATTPWLRHRDRATRLAVTAAAAALDEAGLLTDDGLTVPGSTVGVVASSNFANLDTVFRVVDALADRGTDGVSARDLPNASSNVLASTVAIHFGVHGPVFMLCNGATSGLDAVGWATLALATGRARHMLVVAAESAEPTVRALVAGDHPAPLLEGAAAMVLKAPCSAASTGPPGRVAITGYARRRDVPTAVRAAGATDEVGLWLPPPGGRADGPSSARTHDLGGDLPPASGARGLLQCVAATAWLSRRPPDCRPSALAAAGGGPDDDAAAAVLLTAL